MKQSAFDDIARRKSEHVTYSLDAGSQSDITVFDKYRLPYVALPELALDDVDTSTELLGKTVSQPLIISSMTGGSLYVDRINRNLSLAAEATGVALGVGSQRIALEKRDAVKTFKIVRRNAPHAVLFANMGAVQLNYGLNPGDYRRVVDMIEADALYLHLNPLQESIQPSGDTNYSDLIKKIGQVVKKVNVPVFVKEVGHGIDAKTAKALLENGVKAIDVAGVGGTSYAWIEAQRARNPHFARWFKNYGLPTDECLTGIKPLIKKDKYLISSGGVRGPVDGLISRCLGADYYAAALPFLDAARQATPDQLIDLIKTWQLGLKIALFVSGAPNWQSAGQLQLSKAKP